MEIKKVTPIRQILAIALVVCTLFCFVVTAHALSIEDNNDAWIWPTEGKEITMTFGKPLEVKELGREQQKNLGAHVREIIVDMLEKGPGYIPEDYGFTSKE